MKVLWHGGPQTTGEIVAALAAEGVELADSTVRTMLGILRDKEQVVAEPEGRGYRYRAVVSRVAARRSALRHLVSRFFDDSREELVLNLLSDEELDEAELARLRRMIQED